MSATCDTLNGVKGGRTVDTARQKRTLVSGKESLSYDFRRRVGRAGMHAPVLLQFSLQVYVHWLTHIGWKAAVARKNTTTAVKLALRSLARPHPAEGGNTKTWGLRIQWVPLFKSL